MNGFHSPIRDAVNAAAKALAGRSLTACLLVALLTAWIGCGKPKTKVDRSFYHWKTGFAPSDYEKEALNKLHVGRLFVKYFDIDWPESEQQAVPQAKVYFRELPDAEVIPTIFITNRAMRKVGESGAPALADRTWKLIQGLHPKELPALREVQIDCDWTQNTRSAYFAFLQHLRTRLDSADIQLSATIRLHQLKYPKQTGVPPVDRGMLMFYNMGDLQNPQEDNSILDIAKGQEYLGKADEYALPLDVALPIFAWGVLLRHGKPIRLLNNLRMETVAQLPWCTPAGPHLVHVDSSHYLLGNYLYAGDEIRLEEVSDRDLLASARTLQAHLRAEDRSVILYQLDSLTIRRYREETLDSVYGIFEANR